MKKQFNTRYALVLLAGLGLASCDKFKVTETKEGDKILFHDKGDGKKGKEGDILTFDLVIKTPNDTTVKDTYREHHPIQIPLQKGQFKGSFENGLMQLSQGDSATIFVSADSLYSRIQQPLPTGVTKGSDLKFIVKVHKIQTREDFMHEINKRKDGEGKTLEDYATKNLKGATKTPEGLYYAVVKAGTGISPAAGDTVVVHYTGKFFNGKVFDSSLQAGQPLVFPIGQGMVIPGWEMALSKMKKGEKSTFVIPSSLAYGEQGAGGVIEPFTPLVFDIELLDVKKGKK